MNCDLSKSFLFPLTALLMSAAPASAVDLEALGSQERKYYCIAYISLANQYAKDSGQIDEDAFAKAQLKLATVIYTKGDNYNYSRDFRRIELAANKIISENPSVDEVLSRSDSCKKILRMR